MRYEFFSTAIGNDGREQWYQITPRAEYSSVSQRQLLVENVIKSIPGSVINDAFKDCKSLKNFAKRLTFKLFSEDERHGRNCTGWVPGRVQNKKQLDPIKLEAVKKKTFEMFNVENPNYTWKRECIKAIDAALRKENAKQRTCRQEITPSQKQKNSLKNLKNI